MTEVKIVKIATSDSNIFSGKPGSVGTFCIVSVEHVGDVTHYITRNWGDSAVDNSGKWYEVLAWGATVEECQKEIAADSDINFGG